MEIIPRRKVDKLADNNERWIRRQRMDFRRTKLHEQKFQLKKIKDRK